MNNESFQANINDNDLYLSKNKKLAKLIEKNPNLPLVYFVNDDNLGDYGCTFLTNYTANKGHIYINDERVFDDYDDALDYNREYYSDWEDYFNLSDDEYDKLMVDKTNELENYEAIIIWVR